MSVTAPVEHHLDGPLGDICWFEWNEAGAGPTLLLLHATGFHARLWDQVVAALPAGTHVVAPDLLGHGRSEKPELLADWPDAALALLPLIDRLGDRPLIGCGHSMGGYVLSRLAAERSDAFQDILLIDPVVLPPDIYASTAYAVPDPSDHPVSRRRNSWQSTEQMADHFRDRKPYASWDPQVLADYCRYGLLADEGGEGLILACPPRVEASIYQNAPRTNPYTWVDRIKADVSILRAPTAERAGEMDFSKSPTWLGAADAFGAKSDMLWADNSHFIPMEAPGKVAALLTEMLTEKQALSL